MRFKVGDWVCINPKYTNGVDTVRGLYTDERTSWDDNEHIILWEDGAQGNGLTATKDDYLILV